MKKPMIKKSDKVGGKKDFLDKFKAKMKVPSAKVDTSKKKGFKKFTYKKGK